MPEPPVVLVEGESDARALRVLAESRGLAERLHVVAMGGVTNVGHHVRRLAEASPDRPVLGLCDAGERRFLERARPALDEVFVCDRDLEDELIRALGPHRVVHLLAELDELGRFRTFQGQPGWRDRPLADQLHRFAGTRSGRKATLAERMAREVAAAETPLPVAGLLDRLGRE